MNEHCAKNGKRLTEATKLFCLHMNRNHTEPRWCYHSPYLNILLKYTSHVIQSRQLVPMTCKSPKFLGSQ